MRRDKYGCLRPGGDDRWGRPALWTRAIRSGCLAEDLANAYNVTPEAVMNAVRRYQANGKPKQG